MEQRDSVRYGVDSVDWFWRVWGGNMKLVGMVGHAEAAEFLLQLVQGGAVGKVFHKKSSFDFEHQRRYNDTAPLVLMW